MLTLREQCLALPYRDRITLCEELKNSIIREDAEGRHPGMHRAHVLIECMEDIIGEPLMVRCQEERLVWGRAMVVYQLSQEQFGVTEIARIMGRHHSTIIHMRRKMKDALDYPHMYKDVIDIWKQFQNNIRYDIHKGTTQRPVSLGG